MPPVLYSWYPASTPVPSPTHIFLLKLSSNHVSTPDSQITFWDMENAEQTSGIDERKDISWGHRAIDRTTAANAASTIASTPLPVNHSAKGTRILAAGNDRYICLYDIASSTHPKVHGISEPPNRWRPGISQFETAHGSGTDTLDDASEASNLEDRINRSFPGASQGAMSAQSPPGNPHCRPLLLAHRPFLRRGLYRRTLPQPPHFPHSVMRRIT